MDTFQACVEAYYRQKLDVDASSGFRSYPKAINNQLKEAQNFLDNPRQSDRNGASGHLFEALMFFGLSKIIPSGALLLPQPGAIDFQDHGPDYALYGGSHGGHYCGGIAVALSRGGGNFHNRRRNKRPQVCTLNAGTHGIYQGLLIQMCNQPNQVAVFNKHIFQRTDAILSVLHPILQNK